MDRVKVGLMLVSIVLGLGAGFAGQALGLVWVGLGFFLAGWGSGVALLIAEEELYKREELEMVPDAGEW